MAVEREDSIIFRTKLRKIVFSVRNIASIKLN